MVVFDLYLYVYLQVISLLLSTSLGSTTLLCLLARAGGERGQGQLLETYQGLIGAPKLA